MRMRNWAWLCGVGLWLATSSALAEERHDYPECTSKPTEADVEGAQGAFKAGKARYDEGNRERAILYWEDAYRMDCTAHDLLINLATAYELQGNKEQALVALETYLKRVPESKKKEQVSRRIEQLKSQVEADRKKAQAAAQPTAVPGQPPPGQVVPATGTGLGATPGSGPEPTPTSKRPWTPLIVVGAGGVALIAGIGVLVGPYSSAASDVSAFKTLCQGGRACPNDEIAKKANDAQGRRNSTAAVGGVLVGVGALMIAGGLYWYLMPRREPANPALQLSPSTSLTPTVGRGYAGFELNGSF